MTVVEPLQRPAAKHRVCVWFGEHVIVDHVAEPAVAARFEAAMRRRFASLRVTTEQTTLAVVPDADDQ